jgi:hypothetical protein
MLPDSFLQPSVIGIYAPILEKNFIEYDNVIDYLNSTIKSLFGNSITFASRDSDLNYWLMFDIISKYHNGIVMGEKVNNEFTVII